MTKRIGVLGAGGRMGITVCNAIHEDPDLELVAAVDPVRAETKLSRLGGPTDLVIQEDVSSFVDAGVDVGIDFTEADAARANVPWMGEHGIHAVVGTTGMDDSDIDTIRAAFTTSNCLIAANFAISAVLMMRFAELAAPYFDTSEIIELHHNLKIDAPSGTAIVTAERMAEASSQWLPDPTQTEVLPGARGGSGPGGIRIHSVRMHGLIAHQEVILGAEGQSLLIRQDSYDRTSFMPGIVLAAKNISDHPGVTIGLDAFLGL